MSVLKQKKLFVIILLVLSVFISCGGQYGSLGHASTKVPLVKNARTGVLPSGLTYYIFENKKPKDRAYLTIAVNAGSVLEDDDEQGLAHFVEHMAFNGTEHFPGTEVIKYLQSTGMRFGPHINAYTSYDRTVYGIEVPTEVLEKGIKEIPSRALQIIDDWTHSITFLENDVVEERQIIMEEFRARLGASDRATKQLTSVLFKGSKYAERRPIGLPDVFNTAPSQKLSGFYHKWYRPDNMAVIFVGDFDGATLEKNLISNFTIAPVKDKLVIPVYNLPDPVENKIDAEIFTDSELLTSNIEIYYKQKTTPVKNDLKSYRENLINVLVERIVGERFQEAVQNPDTPYFEAESGYGRYVKGSLHYYFGGIAKNGLIKETLVSLLLQKESIKNHGFLNSEIERAKTSLLSDLKRQANEKEKINSSVYISSFTENFLSNESEAGIEWDLKAAEILLPRISEKDIHDTMKNYFAANEVLVFISANDAVKDALPSQEEIIEIVKASSNVEVEKPVEDVLEGELLNDVPNPGSIETETIDDDSDSLTWILNNGAKVIIKKTQNQNDQIVLSALSRGGTASVPIADFPSAKYAAELVNASGLGDYKLSALIKKLTGKQVSISFNTSQWNKNIDGSSTNKDLKTFFEILYLLFTEPRLDTDSLAVLKEHYKTSLSQRKDNPEAFFRDELGRIVYNSNPYFMPANLSEIEAIDIKTAREFVSKALNPADYTFIFIGNIDIETIKPFVKTYIASIPQKETFNQWADIKINWPQKIEKKMNMGKEDKSAVFLGHFMNLGFNLQDAITAEVLNEYLDIVLIQEIREKLGGVYSVSAYITLSPTPPAGRLDLQTYFNCSPSRVDELSIAIEAEFAKVAGGNINPETFDNAKSALVKNLESSMQKNNYIARYFANCSVLFNIPLSSIYKKPEYYNNITQSDISAMMRTLIGRGLVKIVMNPENS